MKSAETQACVCAAEPETVGENGVDRSALCGQRDVVAVELGWVFDFGEV